MPLGVNGEYPILRKYRADENCFRVVPGVGFAFSFFSSGAVILRVLFVALRLWLGVKGFNVH